MGRDQAPRGYTLIEVVVALFVFTVGALALVAGSAVVGRELNADGVREEASRIATRRLEISRSECRSATSGHETTRRVSSEWRVALLDSSRVSVVESVSYSTPAGARTETFRAVFWCRS